MEGRSYVWYLNGRMAEDTAIQDVRVDATPFRIGRRSNLSLTLPYAAVSNRHAEIITEANSLSIRDLGSTNGTFVNGVRVTGEMPLQAGDLIQFADVTLRLRQEELPAAAPQIEVVAPPELCRPDTSFDSFLMMRAVVPHYQPIISLRDQRLVGNEVLARSQIEGLRTPAEMFLVASKRNLEEELSHMLRMACIEQRAANGQTSALFLNTHPSEIVSQGLLHSLRQLRELNILGQVTFEIREPDASNTVRLKQLREAMTELGIKLAYDNFGSGQSRRTELAVVRPDFVKFDMHLIRDIHLAPVAQQTMLGNLIRMVHELGSSSVAVGVENELEHAVCRELGFQYGQGFYYGKPSSTNTAAAESGIVILSDAENSTPPNFVI